MTKPQIYAIFQSNKPGVMLANNEMVGNRSLGW